MTIVNPSPISTLPPAPIKGQVGFSGVAEVFTVALQPFGEQVDAAGVATYSNALDAKSSADIASAAAALFGVETWLSNKAYSVGETVISPAALLAGANPVYICKQYTDGFHIDPYSDGTRWSAYNPVLYALTGGAVSTGSVVLTAASGYAQAVSSAGYGASITMPDATTVSTGAKWQLHNNGAFDYRVIDYSGGLLGFLKAGKSTTIGLSSNSSAAGVWSCTGLENIGVKGFVQVLSTVSNLVLKSAVKLTSSKTLLLVGVNSGALYAVVHDNANSTTSNALLCRATHSVCAVVKMTDSTALLVSHDGSSTLQSAVITVAVDGSISIGTIASDTISAPSLLGQFLAVGTSYVLSYYRGGGYLKAFSTSGGIVSIGTEVSVGNSDGSPPAIYVNGSIVRALSVISTYIKCIPYTASGSALTAGTLAQTSTGATGNGFFRSLQNDSGNILACHQYNGNWVASIFKISGAVESVSNANISTYGNVTTPAQLNNQDSELIKKGNKALFIGRGNQNADTFYVNVITDANGVVSCGTSLSEQTGYSSVVIQNKAVNGFVLNSQPYQSSFQNFAIIYDYSGSSPVKLRTIPVNLNGNTSSFQSPSDRLCIAHPNTFVGNKSAYMAANVAKMDLYEFSDSSSKMSQMPSDVAYYNVNFFRGFNGDNEAYTYVATIPSINNGVTIKILEVV